MIHLTICVKASEMLLTIVFVASAACLRARPNNTAHAKIPMQLAFINAEIGFETTFNSKFFNTSVTSPGGVKFSTPAPSSKVTGNMKLASTATKPAKNVPKT